MPKGIWLQIVFNLPHSEQVCTTWYFISGIIVGDIAKHESQGKRKSGQPECTSMISFVFKSS